MVRRRPPPAMTVHTLVRQQYTPLADVNAQGHCDGYAITVGFAGSLLFLNKTMPTFGEL